MESSGPRRRFSAPWSFAKTRHGYEVRDLNGILLVSIYARDNPHTRRWADYQKYLTSDEAWRIAKAVARIPELLNRHHPGFEASDNPRWSKSYPYHVALATCYVQENYDWIAACCARNAVPFERTGGVIEVEGWRWCVYKFVRQLDAIRFWDAFDGRWMQRQWFIYPARPKDLPKLRDLPDKCKFGKRPSGR